MTQTHAPTFGDLLKQVRKRGGMTQGDLAAAVGYSVSFVSALEQNRRLPDIDAVLQVFVPALGLLAEPHLATRLVELAASARGERPPIAIMRQRETQIAVTEAHGERATHLPAAPTDLIGRTQEVRQLCQRLPGHTGRLLTLVGPPGIGKTQLALAVAAHLHYRYPDGAAFVALAAVSDAVVMAATIAASVGWSDASPTPPKTKLIECLRRKTMLLVLDNLEQIRDGAHLIANLLAECPGLCILATSRERLHLRAEQRFHVPPLDLNPAIELFVRRAQAVNADFILTPQNQPTLAAICQRLDRLPLALELCAAQIDLLAPAQLLAQLHDRRLDLLVEGAHDLPPRQRTLRTAIQHSYRLLDEAERTLLHRLGVFVGGFDVPAVAAVVADSMAIAARPLTATLHALIGKSLVRAETTPSGEQRFVMLETIREYALERLDMSGEAEVVRRQHATYFLALAEAAAPQLQGAQQREWLERLAREYDNLRAAVGWTVESGETEVELRLIGAIWQLWEIHGYWSEARVWLDRVLARSSASEHTLARAKAQLGAGVLARMQGDYTMARTQLQESGGIFAHLEDKRGLALSLRYLAAANWDSATTRSLDTQSLAIYRESTDRRDIALALETLGDLAWAQSDYMAAGAYYTDGLALFRELSDKRNIAQMLHNVGDVALLQRDYASARTPYEESLALFRELSDKVGIANTLGNLGDVALDQGDHHSACTHYEERLAISRTLGHKWGMAIALGELGNVARCQRDYGRTAALYEESLAIWRELENKGEILWALGLLARVAHTQGDDRRATALFEECLELSQEQEDQPGIAGCLEGLAGIAAIHRQPIRATRLFAAGVWLRETIGGQVQRQLIDRAEYDRNVAAIRAQLNDATFAAAWAAGQALSLEQAIAEALGASQINDGSRLDAKKS